MPWTKSPDVTAADILAFEEMLDQIAQADRAQRLREAYNHLGEGWEIAGNHCTPGRQDHHD